jgi:hypothetical protein
MRIFEDGDWDSFAKAINKAIPIYGDLPLFDREDGSTAVPVMLSVHQRIGSVNEIQISENS